MRRAARFALTLVDASLEVAAFLIETIGARVYRLRHRLVRYLADQ